MTKQMRPLHKFSVAFHALALVFWAWGAAVYGADGFVAIMVGWSAFFGAYSLARLREGVRA